jgi:hypothetical protein
VKFLKHYGWDSTTMEEIDHIVSTTRESIRHLVFGMRLRPKRTDFLGNVFNDDEWIIAVYDRRDLTTYVRYESKPMKDREELTKRYVALLHHYDLECCCREHAKEFFGDTDDFMNNDEPTEAQMLASFLADEDDVDLGSFLDDDDDPLSAFLRG